MFLKKFHIIWKLAPLMKSKSRKFFVWDENKVRQIFEKAIEISSRHKNNINGEIIPVRKTPEMFKNLGHELKRIQFYEY